jgi:hypothetical protein
MRIIERLKRSTLSGSRGSCRDEAGLKNLRVPALCAAAVLLAEMPAAAYTDPGSGALLWQILVAGFVGAMFYFRRFTQWFRRKKNKGVG